MQINNLQFEIQSEQNTRLATSVEAFMISFFAIITALLLPQLLFQFLIKNPNFDPNQSALLTNLPGICYGVMTFVVLYAVVSNFLRSRRIRQLKQDLELMQFAFDEEGYEDPSALAEAIAAAEKKSEVKPAKKAERKTASSKRSEPSKTKSVAKKTTKRRSTKKN